MKTEHYNHEGNEDQGEERVRALQRIKLKWSVNEE